jgi:hypothetical protein
LPSVNAYNPWIHSFALRCNGDIKLIPFGIDTKNIVAYIVNYATKKQGRAYNVSALMAIVMERVTRYASPSVKQGADRLLVSLANAMNSRQEIGAPMVIATLMGWAPRVASHSVRTIKLGDVHRILRTKILLNLHPLQYMPILFC